MIDKPMRDTISSGNHRGSKMSKSVDLYEVPVKTENRKWTVAAAVIASLSTALVLSAVFVGILFSMKSTPKELDPTKTEKWVSWTRQAGDIEIHESALIDDERQTITMVSAEAYRVNEDNSVALHDFRRGYVALRDFAGKICLVTKIRNPNFQEVKEMAESRKGKTLSLQPMVKGHAQSRNMTSSELGSRLSEFCEGVRAVWFDITPGKVPVKRNVPQDFIVACLYGSVCVPQEPV